MSTKYGYPAIQNLDYIGPYFGTSELGLDRNLRDGITYAYRDCNFFYDGKIKLIEEKGETRFRCGGNGGVAYFNVLEFEVYKVIY